MGYVKIEVKIRNIHKPELEDFTELLVDTVSIYTILNSKRLEKLDVKPRIKDDLKLPTEE